MLVVHCSCTSCLIVLFDFYCSAPCVSATQKNCTFFSVILLLLLLLLFFVLFFVIHKSQNSRGRQRPIIILFYYFHPLLELLNIRWEILWFLRTIPQPLGKASEMNDVRKFQVINLCWHVSSIFCTIISESQGKKYLPHTTDLSYFFKFTK